MLLTSEETISRNHTRAHPNSRSRWVCCGFDATFVTSRAVNCTGKMVVTAVHFCNGGDKRFESQRGLSLRKRLAHPDYRNEKLLGPPPIGEQRPTALRPSIWSNCEIRILQQYEKLYAGHVHMNTKVAAHLPFKTNKQMSNYRTERRKWLERQLKRGNGLCPNDGISEISVSHPIRGWGLLVR
jgi:hypothetical protein